MSGRPGLLGRQISSGVKMGVKSKSGIKVGIDIEKIVQVTENHGGYLGGVCQLCGACGWLDYPRYGYPSSFRKSDKLDKEQKSLIAANRVVHKSDCPMNEHLTPEGELK